MAIATVLVIALACALLFTPLVRGVAVALGVVDHSDGKRKLHDRPVPLWGGAAVFMAFLAAVVAAGWFAPSRLPSEWWLLSGALICLVGCCDDAWRLSPRWKLLGQTVAALPIVLTFDSAGQLAFGGLEITLGWWGAPLLLLWLLACTNAMNFLDGVDGLASSCGLVAAAFLATAAEARGDGASFVASVALCGALAGFLVYNIAPARIFLGDAGSMLIGLLLGVLSLEVFQTPRGAYDPLSMCLLLAVPLLDVALAVTRRTLSGRPFWQADRFHIHHRLLERGCSAHEIMAVLAGLCVLSGVAATVTAVTGAHGWAIAATCTMFTLLIRMELLGHHEWALVKGRVARGLVAAAAWLGEHSLGAALPEFAELAAEGDAANWKRLCELTLSANVARLEVQCGSGTRLSWSESSGTPSQDAGSSWSVRCEFRGADDAWCRVQLHLKEQAAAHPWQILENLAALRHFGQFWAEQAGGPEVRFSTVRRAA